LTDWIVSVLQILNCGRKGTFHWQAKELTCGKKGIEGTMQLDAVDVMGAGGSEGREALIVTRITGDIRSSLSFGLREKSLQDISSYSLALSATAQLTVAEVVVVVVVVDIEVRDV